MRRRSSSRAESLGYGHGSSAAKYYGFSDWPDARTVEWEVEARAVDDEGEAAGEWIAVASESVTAAENTPQRKSYRYTVAAGRYEVRVKRTNDKSSDARAGHEIRWGGLKTFLENTPEFGDVTLLAVRMRATDRETGEFDCRRLRRGLDLRCRSGRSRRLVRDATPAGGEFDPVSDHVRVRSASIDIMRYPP